MRLGSGVTYSSTQAEAVDVLDLNLLKLRCNKNAQRVNLNVDAMLLRRPVRLDDNMKD